MHRYWIEFDFTRRAERPAGTALGCGVTAEDRRAALALLERRLFDGSLPPVSRLVEDVAVDDLESRHVRPNMGNPAVRGIWFPVGYE
jgi:hypothetical protein